MKSRSSIFDFFNLKFHAYLDLKFSNFYRTTCESRFIFDRKIKYQKIMNYKTQMAKWMQDHPNATLQEAFEAGWMLCTEAWCHGKREKLEKLFNLIKEIL